MSLRLLRYVCLIDILAIVLHKIRVLQRTRTEVVIQTKCDNLSSDYGDSYKGLSMATNG